MSARHLLFLLITSVCFGPSATYGASEANLSPSTVVEPSAAPAETEEEITWAQVAMVVAVIVLVLLVAVLVAGYFIWAIETETPEQRMERKLAQERLKNTAAALGAYAALNMALKKLK